MEIKFGNGKTQHGPGVEIVLTGEEVVASGRLYSGQGPEKSDLTGSTGADDLQTAVALLKKYLFMEKLTSQEIRTAVDLVIGHSGEEGGQQ